VEINMDIGTYEVERAYTKRKGYGSYTPLTLVGQIQQVSQPGRNAVRPLPYFSFIERFKQAWDVFTYRADALYWKEN
jgi:hypothetical protein